MFFKPYQLDALKALLARGRGMNSREVWEAVGSDKIFRASIINFLADAVENGLLQMTTETGKGGHRGICKARFYEAGTKKYLKKCLWRNWTAFKK